MIRLLKIIAIWSNLGLLLFVIFMFGSDPIIDLKGLLVLLLVVTAAGSALIYIYFSEIQHDDKSWFGLLIAAHKAKLRKQIRENDRE